MELRRKKEADGKIRDHDTAESADEAVARGGGDGGSDAHVLENLERVLALYAKTEARVDAQQKFVERAADALGRPRTIYVILLVVAAWMVFNMVATRLHLLVLDSPPFPWLQAAIDLAALLTTTVVLTTQRREGRHGEHRAFLDLQVNMLAERKIAKLIALVEELRRDLPNVRDREDLVAEAMTHAVNPELVISAIEEGIGPESSTETKELPEEQAS